MNDLKDRIVKEEDISAVVDNVIRKIPWKSSAFEYASNCSLSIYIDVIIPNEIALMAKLTNIEPIECQKMRVNIHNNILFNDFDFYSDKYETFVIYLNLVDNDRTMKFNQQLRIYDRLRG